MVRLADIVHMCIKGTRCYTTINKRYSHSPNLMADIHLETFRYRAARDSSVILT